MTHVASFSFFTAVCFTINYIVGCGFLGIPSSFVASGMVAGPLLVVFFAFLCNITKDYILEALSRLEALEKVNFVIILSVPPKARLYLRLAGSAPLRGFLLLRVACQRHVCTNRSENPATQLLIWVLWKSSAPLHGAVVISASGPQTLFRTENGT